MLKRIFASASVFQSTPPGWEATSNHLLLPPSIRISIHASRVGGDVQQVREHILMKNFNPRLPGGRRPLLE